MGVILVSDHHKGSEANSNNADIIDAFATLASSSLSPAPTLSLSPSKSYRVSSTPLKTLIPDVSPILLATSTSSKTPTSTPRATATPIPTSIPTPSKAPTPTPVATQIPTVSPSPTPNPTSSPSSEPTALPSSTPEIMPTPTPEESLNISSLRISEVQVGGVDAGDEFIELYNPSNSDIDISGWSIQYLTGSTTDITKIVKKNFEAGDVIPTHGFFLIARAKDSTGKDGYTGAVLPDLSHRSFSLSGASTGGKIFLVNDAIKIDSLTDANISDSLDYSFLVPDNGKSLERQNHTGSFELRDIPDPKDTQSSHV